MRSISFRRLSADDLQQVFLWLIRPHVTRGYAAPPSSFMEMVAKYGPRTSDANVVKSYVFTVDGRDAGYIQAYDVASFPEYAALVGRGEGTTAIDLFIGEPEFLHRGVGTRVIDRFVNEIVLASPAVRACAASPAEGNLESLRAFEKAGFRRWKVVRDGEKPAECVMLRERDPDIAIAPIDLDRDAATCIAFRRDSFEVSFGSRAGCDDEMGADGSLYLAKLRDRMAKVPEGNAHVWHEGRIVGQTEMRFSDEPSTGYVNFFYLVPEWRHRGAGRILHDHAVKVFSDRGMRAIRLSVSRTNEAALAFYRRLGWRRLGARPHKEAMDLMEFPL